MNIFHTWELNKKRNLCRFWVSKFHLFSHVWYILIFKKAKTKYFYKNLKSSLHFIASLWLWQFLAQSKTRWFRSYWQKFWNWFQYKYSFKQSKIRKKKFCTFFFNIIIFLIQIGLGDTEYLAAFQSLILPMAYEVSFFKKKKE